MALNINLPHWYLDKPKVKKLPAGQFMTLVYLFRYSVFNQTDGHLPEDILDDLPRTVGNTDYINGLTENGLLEPSKKTGYTYYLTDYKETQSTAAEITARLERSRELNRRRQADYREREKQKKAEQDQAENFLPSEATNPTTGTGDYPPGYNPYSQWATAAPGSGGTWQ